MTSTTSPSRPVERPRDRIYGYALDRLASLSARATIECREPTCGDRGEDGELVSCGSSSHCGEKMMLAGWRRELQVMRDIKALVERLEQKELEATAAADRGKKGARK
jgi:hypothetical protein